MELGYPVVGRVSGGRSKEYWVSCDGPCRLCSWRTGVRLVPRWKEIKRSRFPGISQQEIYRHALLSSSHSTNFWQETKSLSKTWIIKGWHAFASALWCSSDCTHAHNHVTKAVAAMDTCFDLVRAHHHGIVMCEWHGFVHVHGVGHDTGLVQEKIHLGLSIFEVEKICSVLLALDESLTAWAEVLFKVKWPSCCQ